MLWYHGCQLCLVHLDGFCAILLLRGTSLRGEELPGLPRSHFWMPSSWGHLRKKWWWCCSCVRERLLRYQGKFQVFIRHRMHHAGGLKAVGCCSAAPRWNAKADIALCSPGNVPPGEAKRCYCPPARPGGGVSYVIFTAGRIPSNGAISSTGLSSVNVSIDACVFLHNMGVFYASAPPCTCVLHLSFDAFRQK